MLTFAIAQSLILQPLALWTGPARAQSCPLAPTTSESREAFDPATAPFAYAVDDGADDLTSWLYSGPDIGGSDGGDEGDGASTMIGSGGVGGLDGDGGDGVDPGDPRDATMPSDPSPMGMLEIFTGCTSRDWFCTPPLVHDPIDVQRADKRHVQLDYASGGAAGLRLARTYHSNDAVNAAAVTVPIGRGWHHFYDRSLQVVSATQVRLHRANGRTVDFNGSGANWTSALPAGVLTPLAGGWQYINHRDVVETYDSGGRLLSLVSGGIAITLQYSAGRLVSVTNPFGRVVGFSYDAAGRLGASTLPGGSTLAYTYDGAGNLASLRFADGSVRQYTYENTSFPNALTGVIDESGRRRLTWSYDSMGRPVHGHYGSGSNGINITYAANTVTTTDARGTQRTRSFSTAGGRSALVGYQTAPTADSPATSWSFSYDSAGNPTALTSRSGEVRQFAADSRARPTMITRAAGTAQALTTLVSWHPTWRKPTQIAAAGVTWNRTLDNLGRITQVTRSAGGVTATMLSVVYNAQNLVQSVTNARGATTTFTYDTAGNRAAATNALNQVTTYSNYTAHGQVGRIQRADGVVITQTFDTRGRVATRTVAGLTTSFAYDGAGRLSSVTAPDGSWRSFTYDAAGKLASTANHRSESATVTRDAGAQPTVTSVYTAGGSLAQTAQQTFDALGRVTRTTDSRGWSTQYNYAADARPSGATDPVGLTRTLQLDLLDRTTALTQPNTTAMQQVTGSPTATSTFGYDSRGNHASVSDTRAVSTAYAYDAANRRIQESGADAGASNYVRNAAGDITSATDPRGVALTRTLDAIGRVTAITSSAGGAIGYTYVAGRSDGLLASMSDPSGSTTWTYDSAGRVLSKAQLASGGVTRTVNITRDALGRPTAITYPSGTVVGINYGVDTVSSLTVNGLTLLNNIAYRPFGQVATGWTWGNGSAYSRSFDADGRITSVTLGSRTRSYSYDAAGRISGFTDQGAGGPQASSFTYDQAHQITGYSGPQGTYGYAYDTNGNRLSTVINGVASSYSYTAGSNRLAGANGVVSYTYNADGSATGDGAVVGGGGYTYDGLGRSATWTRPEATNLVFAYNGLGQRVSKLIQTWKTCGPALAATTSPTGGASTVSAAAQPAPAAVCTPGWVSKQRTHYLYDDAGRFIGEYDTTTTRWQDTVWFNGQPVAVVQADGVYYVHADHLATPRSIVKASNGAEVWRWDSEPFGANSPTNPNPASGGLAYNVRFPGQYRDVESGLHYNGMRDYQPATGRYLQADPIGLRGGLARYGYALANPLRYMDPSGMGPEILMPYANRGTTYGSPYAFERYDRGPSSWSQLQPGAKLIILTGAGAAVGGVAGGLWGARVGLGEALSEGTIASIGLVPDGAWAGAILGLTTGAEAGALVGTGILIKDYGTRPTSASDWLTNPSAAGSCPVPR